MTLTFDVALWQTPLPEQEGPTESSSFDVEAYNTRDLAVVMTQLDWEAFNKIHEVCGLWATDLPIIEPSKETFSRRLHHEMFLQRCNKYSSVTCYHQHYP